MPARPSLVTQGAESRVCTGPVVEALAKPWLTVLQSAEGREAENRQLLVV